MGKSKLTLGEVYRLSRDALQAGGADETGAACIARATREAEADGLPNVGLSHLLDYLEALKSGQLNGRAEPLVQREGPACFKVDGDAGSAHLAFGEVFADLADAAHENGVAALAVRNVFTCGVVGFFVEFLARRGLVAQACANAPATVAPWGGSLPFFGTNPVAFAAPLGREMPLVVDQATSATAFVNIRQAAREGRPIRAGWGLDARGRPTTDASAALEGTVAPAGEHKGTNMALMVDALAAGLGGAGWSYQSPGTGAAGEPLNVGLFITAFEPRRFAGEGFERRLAEWLEVYKRDFGGRVPGEARWENRRRAVLYGVEVDDGVLRAVKGYLSA